MGALCAGDKGIEVLPHLDRYAEAVGLAFQVQDDILDIISDTETLGKPQGSDQNLNKSTYPALLGLEGAMQKRKTCYKKRFKLCRQCLTILSHSKSSPDTPSSAAINIIKRTSLSAKFYDS